MEGKKGGREGVRREGKGGKNEGKKERRRKEIYYTCRERK